MRLSGATPGCARGFTLLEVLITVVILAIGMLGLASLQSTVQVTQIESYQRAQASLLLEDMVARINANRANAASYVTGVGAPLGSGSLATCTPTPGLAQDQCEWGNALKGASEKSGGTAVGGMVQARGCVEQVQAANPAPGVCRPGIYRVTVAWQGMNKSAEPAVGCGAGLYGATGYRRAIAAQIVIGLNSCSS